MKNQTKKMNPTKLLLTATICASIMFGASACNNNNNANMNNNGDVNNNGAANTPTETLDPMTSNDTVSPSAGAE